MQRKMMVRSGMDGQSNLFGILRKNGLSYITQKILSMNGAMLGAGCTISTMIIITINGAKKDHTLSSNSRPNSL